MEHKLMELVTADQVLTWIVIAFLVGCFIYKEWPEIRRRVSGGVLAEQREAAEDKSVNDRLSAIEADIKAIKGKLEHDYARLNDIDRWKGNVQRMIADSLEEREIIMQAMLGVLGGLQELGANGPTKEAEGRIRNYINKKAHMPDD